MTNEEILGKTFKWIGITGTLIEKGVDYKFVSLNTVGNWIIQDTINNKSIPNIYGPSKFPKYWILQNEEQLISQEDNPTKLILDQFEEKLKQENNKFLQWSNLYSHFDRLFYFCEKLDETDSSKPHGDKTIEECGFEEANLISSLCANGNHKPVLDLDFGCQLIPSSTPGCFHLYIDKEVPWDKYQEVLVAMKNAGLLQAGFVDNSIKRGASFLRPPWVKKP